jgi:uncharacterized membrane protein
MKQKIDKEINDPENYKFGILYYNPADKRVIVPKQDRYRGWTINFGNIYAYLLIALVVALFIWIGL